MALTIIESGGLGEFNVGLNAAVGFLNPLGAQIDALISAGLGPFQADLSARLNAALAAQAGLALQVSVNPIASLQVLLSAVAGLQAALQAALSLSLGLGVNTQLSAQLSVVSALSGTLAVQLGALKLAVQLALQVKIPALRLAAELNASLTANPVFFIVYEGNLGTVGSELQAAYNAGLVDGSNQILPTSDVYGITLLSDVNIVKDALKTIFKSP